MDRIAELQRRGRELGRPDGVPVTVYSARIELLDEYRQAGAHRCVFWLPPNDADGARRRIDELADALGLASAPQESSGT